MRSYPQLHPFGLGLQRLPLPLPCAALAQTPITNHPVQTPFSSMAIARDEGDACRVPKPPADLAETAYLRNGYRAILRILMCRRAHRRDTVTAFWTSSPGIMALDALPRFQTSDNPRLPFNVLDLYAMADALEAELSKAVPNRWGLFAIS